MAIRAIRTDGDPILRKKSRSVEVFDDRINTLIEDMYETMDHAEGVGLAAVQVGTLRRVVTIDDHEEHRFYMINPVITQQEGQEVGMEGCLSVPKRQGTVPRFTDITVEYQTLEKEQHTLEASGYLARIIQHELDHLDGVLYTDRVETLYEVQEQEEVEEQA